MAGSLASSYYDWWKGNREPFHFVREGFLHDYSLGIDKIGHAYTAYFFFNAFRRTLLRGGYTPAESYWWGTGFTTLFALSVEVGDGLSGYGFSWEDLTGNMAGLGFGMLRVHVPFLQNFSFKWSYVPTDGWRWPPRLTDHYDAHTYWIALNLHAVLPEGWRDAWPAFLQPAVGYGVDRHQTRREFVVGFDIDIGSLSVKNPELELVQGILSPIHIPEPAVKFTEGGSPRWYLFQKN